MFGLIQNPWPISYVPVCVYVLTSTFLSYVPIANAVCVCVKPLCFKIQNGKHENIKLKHKTRRKLKMKLKNSLILLNKKNNKLNLFFVALSVVVFL